MSKNSGLSKTQIQRLTSCYNACLFKLSKFDFTFEDLNKINVPSALAELKSQILYIGILPIIYAILRKPYFISQKLKIETMKQRLNTPLYYLRKSLH